MDDDAKKIVISLDDVTGPDPVAAEPAHWSPPPASVGSTAPNPALPPMQGYSAGHQVSSFSFAKLGANALLIGLIGGAIGGFVGTLPAEVVLKAWTGGWNIFDPPSQTELVLSTATWVMIIGAFIGFALSSLDGFTSGSAEKGFLDGIKGAATGAGAGFVGGAVAQILFHALLSGDTSGGEGKVYLARIIAWSVFGLLVGLGIGLPFGTRRLVNGLTGGAAGGAFGGLCFQLVASSATGDSILLRLVGMTITGIGIGVGIGLVERARKDSWLVAVGGPMTGKEIILYKPVTLIGSDYRCDLVLVKDPAVAPQHLSLTRDPSGAATLQVTAGATVLINGAPVQSHRLRPGDHLGIGASTLVYQQRVAAPTPAYPGTSSPY